MNIRVKYYRLHIKAAETNIDEIIATELPEEGRLIQILNNDEGLVITPLGKFQRMWLSNLEVVG